MNTRNLIGAFMVAGALFAVFPFAFGKYQEVQAFREALTERELLVQDRQVALDNFNEELGRYREQLTGGVADKFAAMVPIERSTAELVSSLDAIARESGMVLGQVSLDSDSKVRGAVTNVTVLNLEAVGTYESFLRFIAAVEQSVRIMDIQTLEIASAQDGATMQFTLTARAYFLR